jgi:hypothetical protein
MNTLFQALMALFVLASKDGWVQIMYTGLDAVGVDQQVSLSFADCLSSQMKKITGIWMELVFVQFCGHNCFRKFCS